MSNIIDGMTNLFNKKHFESQLQKKVQEAERGGIPLSLIEFDIDKFKAINDAEGLGHAVGDVVIKTVVSIVRSHIRQTDFFARVGGEEFALLFFGDVVGAETLARKVREEVEMTMKKVAAEYDFAALLGRDTVTISVGVATYYGRNGSFSNADAKKVAVELHQAADKAQYVSKNSGRNRVTVAKPLNAPLEPILSS